MLVCTHCNAENPSWAPHCQSCQTPLQPSMNCPTCGALVLKRVNFCGQCGTDLRQGSLERWNNPSPASEFSKVEPLKVDSSTGNSPLTDSSAPPTLRQSIPLPLILEDPSVPSDPALSPQLIHLRTQHLFPLPLEDAILYIGKSNDRQPPDIDLSSFPDSDVVSRIHARLVVRSGDYYLEDLDSSNGTYVNETVLSPHHPHLLTADDRISLGRNNLVSFAFSI